MAGQFVGDLRHAARMIRRMPVVAAVVVGSLGVGIGVNTAVFTWIQGRIVTPLPGVPGSGSLKLIEPLSKTGAYPGASWLEFQDLQERLPAFRDVLAFRMAPFNVGAADWSERTYGMLVSGNYFSALGVRAGAGRLLEAGDALRPGGEPVVVISDRFWRTRFNASPDAVGQTVRVNDRPLTIVGVTTEKFRGSIMGLTFDLWVPATLAPAMPGGSRELENRSQRAYSLVGRLRPGATETDARNEFDAAMRDLARIHPQSNLDVGGVVLPFWQSPRGPQQSLIVALAWLQGVMLLVLLAVCGNMATLVLARASTRAKEVSIRRALGASRARIASLVLTETALLGLGGVLLGGLVAVWGTDAMRAVPMPTPAGLEIRFDTQVDLLSLAFAALLGLGGSLMIGLAPALHLARVEPQWSPRAGTAAVGRNAMRDTLMVVQVALALVVLVVAGVFLQRFDDTQSTDPGFRREGVLLSTYDLRGRARAVDNETAADFAGRLLGRLRALPGIESAAIASTVPLDIHGMPSRVFTLEGYARTDAGFDSALNIVVTSDYFETMGIPILDGRDFSGLDDEAAPPEAIVNEAFVRRYLPATAVAIGRRLDSAGTSYTIAGVARDSLYNAYGEPPTPMLYLSYRDRPSPLGEIHVRTRPGSELAMASDLRRALADLDPTLPLYNVRTLTDHVDRNLVFQRIPARIFVVLGPLLLVLVAVGIYAVVSYNVSQRRFDISIRLALGARPGRVVSQLVTGTLRVVGIGVAAGWVLAYVVDRDLTGGGPLNVVVFAGVPVMLLAVSAFACWWPARRAHSINPIAALKQE